ncbi:Cbb3-type cytochrome c oxidase subunit CcoP [Roseovarius sp. THAF27]|uniref:cytochrome-c oxidase, cbb3-type subunit III n=1 Tax=unclassified Roseovarius TaxID=2614913 RepID=UPI001268A511|nr:MULTISPECIES: cytochrome-c oxidase, cbb3-type subunit III [unclassified Roseovarius]QFT82556.1 Cbb3-type cytochrome c oxidase subunit CcoP [Roseovarius sp. THAF27]QFT98414.1 Cbb3-type cytochrome c oxidase subunit CcoP [Roseovarius sp. THAF8]
MAKKPQDKHEVETTGHEWDGIEEYNNPLPRWWLWVFYATIIWGVWYTIAYPAWPMISGATQGYLGYSTRANVQTEIEAAEAANAQINERLASAELAAIPGDDELAGYARSAGEAVFNTWCVQCHGREGGGATGYPTLSDDAWLWGGTMEAIHTTVTHGIRNDEDPDARYSAMPAFGRDELLTEEEVVQVVNHVMSLSGEPQDAEAAEAGAEVFEYNCAACHGEQGKGMVEQGAPNLTDAIWLYGGDYDALYETVWNSRFGVMPPWQERLTEAEIRAVAAYVHQLGGGE